MKTFNDDQIIGEVKKYLRQNWEKGTSCPCCRQFVKLYKRPLTSSMAWGLLLIYRYFIENPKQEWVHVEDYLKKQPIPSSVRGDFAKLLQWKLIEDKIGLRDDGSRRNGYYRITEKGKLFCQNKIKIQQRVHLYNDTQYGFSGKEINIREALKNKFNYEEIMGIDPKSPIVLPPAFEKKEEPVSQKNGLF